MSTVVVTDSFVLDQGEKLGFYNETGLYIVGSGDPSVTIAGALVLKVDGSGSEAYAIADSITADFATVWIKQGGLVKVAGQSSDASGIAGSFNSNVNFVNDGRVIVAGANNGVALSFANPDANCVNNGLISVIADGHEAIGVTGTVAVGNAGVLRVSGSEATGVRLFNNSYFENSGALIVRAEHVATGVDITGNFTNDGVIRVQGGDHRSIGVVFHQQPGFNVFHNHGDIVVSGEGGCVGVQISAADVDRNVFDNSGLIRAEIAFSAAPVADHAQIALLNSGRILGRVELTEQDDDLGNTGKIVGEVHLAGGNDLYLTGGNGKLVGTVFGGTGDDALTGGKLAEQLVGDEVKHAVGDGSDTLTGGGGGDTLTGGGKSDVFVYLGTADSTATNADLITDLTDRDTIDLSAIDADVTLDGDQTFTLVSSFTGHAGELTVIYDGGSSLTVISGDTDGDGQADLVIRVAGDHGGFTGFAT